MAELIIEQIDNYDVYPCPFCGKSELYLAQKKEWKWIECVNCHAEGPLDLGVSGAVDAWNDRQKLDD